MSPKNKKKLEIIRSKLDKLDNKLLSNLSSLDLIISSFFLFLGDI